MRTKAPRSPCPAPPSAAGSIARSGCGHPPAGPARWSPKVANRSRRASAAPIATPRRRRSPADRSGRPPHLLTGALAGDAHLVHLPLAAERAKVTTGPARLPGGAADHPGYTVGEADEGSALTCSRHGALRHDRRACRSRPCKRRRGHRADALLRDGPSSSPARHRGPVGPAVRRSRSSATSERASRCSDGPVHTAAGGGSQLGASTTTATSSCGRPLGRGGAAGSFRVAIGPTLSNVVDVPGALQIVSDRSRPGTSTVDLRLSPALRRSASVTVRTLDGCGAGPTVASARLAPARRPERAAHGATRHRPRVLPRHHHDRRQDPLGRVDRAGAAAATPARGLTPTLRPR